MLRLFVFLEVFTSNPSQIVQSSPEPMRITKSQRVFMNFPTGFKLDRQYSVLQQMVVGGWSSGKSFICMQKGLLLSAMFPGIEGMICRLHGSDLTSTMCEEFIKQIPEGWIRKVRNRGRSNQVIHLMNGSIIYFSHIRDANAKGTKTRRTGHNLGWFLVEQAEEITRDEWMALNGRLRNSRAKVKFALGNANPAGADWIQKDFFPDWKPLDPKKGVFYRTYVQGNKIGIHVDSEENRLSNGGFVDDGFYDNTIENATQEFIDRYIHASFADFTGRIYKEFSLTSVHNIEPLPYIPEAWDCVGGIDVGGACAWSVLKVFVDQQGNLIVAGEFDKATPLVADVAYWIKTEILAQKPHATFVIDPENKVASTDLSLEGIFAVPAQKAVLTNIQRVSGYMHLIPKRKAPLWMYEYLPEHAKRIEREGACPRLFVFNTCSTFRTEHAEALWDEKRVNQVKKTNARRFDSIDCAGYIVATRPEARQLAQMEDPRLTRFRTEHPQSTFALAELKEELALIAELQAEKRNRATSQMFSDGGPEGAERVAVPIWD